ncbi:MAG: cytochrome c biogenesis protein CcdA [Alloprevotella sp.]
MFKRIFSFVLLAIAAVAAFAQVDFSVSYKRVSPTEIDVVFTGKAAPGWHVYGTNIPDGGPTPASFNIDSAKGARLKGALKGGPGIKSSMDPIFEMEVSYYEGTAVFTQRVELTEKNYDLQGYLKFGACNDENCLPPTSIDCQVKGTDGPAAVAPAADKEEKTETPAPADETPLVAADTTATAPAATADTVAVNSLWTPVISELNAFGNENDTAGKSLWVIFGLGFLGGLIALLTPCVWPIIPMTVSFFLKRAKGDRSKGIRDAITYGVSIVIIYVALGLIITTVFGASALNDLSTNAFFNILFFLMLVVFAASFLGGFEITLPSSWTSSVDSKAEATTGLLSIFLMAFTLSLVSFSCTGPIIGFLLVEVSTSGGTSLAPTIGMLGFAIALAIPFTLFALFPSMLKKTSRGGAWMNQVKVCLGLLELAFAFKFLSVADLAYGWGILDREPFLCLWIVIFATMAFYLFGWIRFPHDEVDPDEGYKTSVPAYFIGMASLAFAIYMVPGLWGAPCKAVSAFSPPKTTQDFDLDVVKVEPMFLDYEQGMAYARANHKPVMVDFTGFGCVNCRKMEMAVWHDSKVRDYLTKDYVLISLYVDDKTPLPETIVVEENGQSVKLRTVGDRWSYLQRSKFGANAQPFYVLLDNDGMPIGPSRSYDEDIDAYVDFLKAGLEAYRK